MKTTRWIDPQPGFDDGAYRKRVDLLLKRSGLLCDSATVDNALVPSSRAWRVEVMRLLSESYVEGAIDCSIYYAHPELAPDRYYDDVRSWLVGQYNDGTIPSYAQLQFDEANRMGIIVYVRFNTMHS